jgi:molybdopterin/thiamine biosynthesis adenylyltransferase
MQKTFNYEQAFSRNIGWLTKEEQAALKNKRIAIAGMGGVGGSHLLTLARLGISAFNIADMDRFELANFNRQAGANLSTLNKLKVEVLSEQARLINPAGDIRVFAEGVNEHNLAEFLRHVDLYIDGLDFFVLDIRRKVFAHCAANGIPAITAAPLGMSAAVLNFLPGRMSFEEYFRLEGFPQEEQLLRFLIGLSPRLLQRTYLADATAVNFAQHRGPSTSIGCELCAGMAAAQALKILLRRGKVLAAPWGLQFDAYRNKMVKTWRPGGNRNPIQRIAIYFAQKQLAAMRKMETRMDEPECRPKTGTQNR